MATLTVLTDTYNRAYCLSRCYESLKRQTSKDFVWLIVDDGSTDNTKDLIDHWILERIIPIRYFWQANQGMHVARNMGNEKCDTELGVWIDSDDYASDDAVEKIISFWRKHGSSEVGGIIALNAREGGMIIGDRLPESVDRANMMELYSQYKIRGDKKVILRSDIAAKYPLPVFRGEKFFPESYRFLLIGQQYKMLLMNVVVCIVVPSADSMTNFKNKVNQYFTCPRGFSFYRKIRVSLSKNYIDKFWQSVHYIATSLIIKNKRFIHESPCPFITLIAIPFGILLYLFIRLIIFK